MNKIWKGATEDILHQLYAVPFRLAWRTSSPKQLIWRYLPLNYRLSKQCVAPLRHRAFGVLNWNTPNTYPKWAWKKKECCKTSGICLKHWLVTSILICFGPQNDLWNQASDADITHKVAQIGISKPRLMWKVWKFFLENDWRPEFWPIWAHKMTRKSTNIQHTSKSSSNDYVNQDWCEKMGTSWENDENQ